MLGMCPSNFAALLRLTFGILTLAHLPLVGQTEKPTPPPTAPAAKLPEPRLGALYHYDYRHPDLGLRNPDGSDALGVHPVDPKSVDFRSLKWHRQQLDGMIAAELDFMIPLFAGPKHPGRGPEGLQTLMKAWNAVDEDGGEPPLIAPFLDTRPLLAPEAGGQIRDLRRPQEIGALTDILLSYFAIIPDYARFSLDDFLVVFVGPSFGVPHERDVLEKIADGLTTKLKKKIYIVAECSWRARRPARFRSDAALMGPRGDTAVRFIGPGYDDSRMKGRGTPRRDREKGRFFRWSFDRVLLEIPTLVVIDSWNDYRQGTAIAPTREHGARYIDLTRRYAARLKSRVVPDAKNPVRLAYPDPLPRPDTGWFRPNNAQRGVTFAATAAGRLIGNGLRLARVEDGPFRRRTLGDRHVVLSPGPGERYLYFGIADEFASRVRGAYRVRVRFIGGGTGRIGLQYDSWDRSSTLDGRYRAAPIHRRSGLARERTLTWVLPDARFSNRQNGGTDFRLSVRGDALELLQVELEPFSGEAPKRPELKLD